MTSPSHVYVVGGRARETERPLEEWEGFDEARVLRVDLESGDADCVIRYVSPPDRCPVERSSIIFKAGARVGRELLVCTQTEVLTYDLDTYAATNEVSLPFFNDLHHVRPLPNGNIAVVVTGLDMVVEMTPAGDVVNEWSVLDERPFARFDRTVDYRKVATTKPHLAHPNYALWLDEALWAVRFHQRDAIRLGDPTDRFVIGDEPPHDGHVLNGHVYFTTVRGNLVEMDSETRGQAHRRVYPIGDMAPGGHVLGWCRGLMLLDEGRRAVLGFTRIRKTKVRRNMDWFRGALRGGNPLRWPDFSMVSAGTLIVIADLVEEKIDRYFDLEPYGLNAIFSIHADLPA